MIYLNDFKVNMFRGIKNLEVKDLGHINLIVGDNNSGKTSVLEAIMLLRNITDFSNILNVVRLRDSNSFSPFRMNAFDNFLYIFNPLQDEKCISVCGNVLGDYMELSLEGTVENVMLDLTEMEDRNSKVHYLSESATVYGEKETAEFQGKMYGIMGKQSIEKEITMNPYTRLSGTKMARAEKVEIIYVSPTEHISGNIFGRMIKEESYKQIVLKVIQIFDENIEDLLYLKNEQTSRPIECIKHSQLGIMPLATYGDGIKKVLLLANSIAKAANGILLVDEIETAIHAKYYDDIFQFVIKACMEFHIQLFATTHSIEAVDGLLNTQYNQDEDIYDSGNQDLIRVITFRKNEEKDKTDARVLSGKEVFANRNNFGFEVRL